MVGMGARVSFTASERAHVVTLIYGLAHRFGSPSQFLTVAPDDSNETIILRLSFKNSSNGILISLFIIMIMIIIIMMCYVLYFLIL